MLVMPPVIWGQSGSSPRPLSVSENARPIWSPSRPGHGDDTAANPDSSSSTLRLVRNGWGQTPPASESTSSSTVLRWRSRTTAETRQTTGFSVPLTPANWQESAESQDSAVRTVAHQEPADPFQDPFGDRLAQNRKSRYQLDPPGSPSTGTPASEDDSTQPAPRSSGLPTLDELLPPYDDGQAAQPGQGMEDRGLPRLDDLTSPSGLPDQPAPTTPSELPAAPEEPGQPNLEQPKIERSKLELPERSEQPSMPEVEPAPRSFQPAEPKEKLDIQTPFGTRPPARPGEPADVPPSLDAPAPRVEAPSRGTPEAGDKPPCARVYNGRNCCDEDEDCRAARLALKQDSIKTISLDITARFKPDAKTVEEENEQEQKQLRSMGSRVWRDRQGQFLAEGRVVDVHHRRIVVLQEDGSTKTILLGQLGEDETCFLAAWWQVPTECSLGYEQQAPRAWQPITYTWKASALCHKPLYFEERQLERYGHTTGPVFQPVLSGAHFFLNVAVLPYKMGINPPNECQYPLGYYRPGSCSPWLLPPAPLSVRGGLLQAGAITGVAFLFP